MPCIWLNNVHGGCSVYTCEWFLPLSFLSVCLVSRCYVSAVWQLFSVIPISYHIMSALVLFESQHISAHISPELQSLLFCVLDARSSSILCSLRCDRTHVLNYNTYQTAYAALGFLGLYRSPDPLPYPSSTGHSG